MTTAARHESPVACPQCGYQLNPNADDLARCSECGGEFRLSHVRARADTLARSALMLIALGSLGIVSEWAIAAGAQTTYQYHGVGFLFRVLAAGGIALLLSLIDRGTRRYPWQIALLVLFGVSAAMGYNQVHRVETPDYPAWVQTGRWYLIADWTYGFSFCLIPMLGGLLMRAIARRTNERLVIRLAWFVAVGAALGAVLFGVSQIGEILRARYYMSGNAFDGSIHYYLSYELNSMIGLVQSTLAWAVWLTLGGAAALVRVGWSQRGVSSSVQR